MPTIPKKRYMPKGAVKVYSTKRQSNWLKNEEDAKFYNTAAWRKLSLSYKMENPTCESKNCTQPSYYTDHIIPVSDGGDRMDRDNLQALCRSCNASKTAKQRTKFNRQ